MSTQTVDDLIAFLEELPLPETADFGDADVVEGDAWQPSVVNRRYRVTAPGFAEQLRANLAAAGWTSAGHTSLEQPLHDTGGLRLLPPGRAGDGLMIAWNTARLDVSIQSGWVR
jgi:hypothetical protein